MFVTNCREAALNLKPTSVQSDDTCSAVSSLWCTLTPFSPHSQKSVLFKCETITLFRQNYFVIIFTLLRETNHIQNIRKVISWRLHILHVTVMLFHDSIDFFFYIVSFSFNSSTWNIVDYHLKIFSLNHIQCGNDPVKTWTFHKIMWKFHKTTW